MNSKLDKTARITEKENELLKFIRAMAYDPLEVRKVLMKYHLAILPGPDQDPSELPKPAAAKPEPNPDQQDQAPNKPVKGTARIISKTYTCPKCKSTNNDIQKKNRYYGLYCADCGRWLRWIPSSKVIKD